MMIPQADEPREPIPERLETPHGILYKPQPIWLQFLILAGAFGGGIGLARLVGLALGGLSENAQIFLYVMYTLVLMCGYSIWMGRLQALGMELLGRGLLKALFTIIVRRKKPENLQELMPTREKLLQFAVRAQRATSSFWMVALPIAMGAGLGSLIMESESPAVLRFLVVASGCVAWGTLLAFVARRGYLPLPEGD